MNRTTEPRYAMSPNKKYNNNNINQQQYEDFDNNDDTNQMNTTTTSANNRSNESMEYSLNSHDDDKIRKSRTAETESSDGINNSYNDDDNDDTPDPYIESFDENNENDEERQQIQQLQQDNSNEIIDSTEMKSMKRIQRTLYYVRILLMLLVVGIITFLIVDTATNRYVLNLIIDFLDWVEVNPISGLFAYVLVYFIATVLFIPASILMIGSGYIFTRAFGLWIGIAVATIASWLGCIVSAIVQFYIARFVLRNLVKRICSKFRLLQAFDTAIQQNGLKICILLRLSPLLNFNSINYAAGGSSVQFIHYFIALIAAIPGIVLGVIVGASIRDITKASSEGTNKTTTIIVCIVTVVFSITAMILITMYTRKELNRTTSEIHIEYNPSDVLPNEHLNQSDVVDALVDAMHDVQIHALTGRLYNTTTTTTTTNINNTNTNTNTTSINAYQSSDDEETIESIQMIPTAGRRTRTIRPHVS